MRAAVALAAVLFVGACSPSNDGGVAAEEPASAPAPTASAPAAAAPLDPAFAGDINARGTEPFWAVEVRGESLTLKRPDHPDVTAEHQGVKMEGDAAVVGDAGLRLTLRRADCSDGMSDVAYPLSAEVVVDGAILRGCATPA